MTTARIYAYAMVVAVAASLAIAIELHQLGRRGNDKIESHGERR